MGEVDPAKLAQLIRRGQRTKGLKKAVDRVTIEVYCRVEVRGYAGDVLIFSMIAPSGPAAQACAQALRNLQSTRGKVI